ncbi:CocE/NonD family hydrolase [Nocardia brasiliensis]|uniref:CocE/NonD family hydrolase n=1 Tax=Nocardia brasiliensis TaxID=37326 RepID=UPI00378C4E4F
MDTARQHAAATDEIDGAAVDRIPVRIYGDDAYPVWHRRSFPHKHPRSRYPGFQPETVLLRAGEVRTEDALPLSCDMFMDRDVAVTLRDGTVMYTDIFRPVQAGEYPAIVAWSPYGKNLGSQLLDDLPNRYGVPSGAVSNLNKWEGPDPAFWVDHGYVILNPDPRGVYDSEGDIAFCNGRQQAEDGYDFVEWAAAQDWSNGRIGFSGNSMLAINQWFIAAARPPHLAAIAPWEGLSDAMRDFLLAGGIPGTWFPETILQHLYGGGLVEDVVRMAHDEPDDSIYWQNAAARLEQIEVPAYIVASYDNFVHTRGTLEGYRRISSDHKWLRIHNTFQWSDYYEAEWTADLLRFFDHYLKGTDNGWEQTPQVRIAVLDPTGDDVVARVVDNWPPSGYDHQRLYLTHNKLLAAEPPKDVASVRYDASPGNTGTVFALKIEEDSELIGYMKLELWVEADGSDDMDLTVSVLKLDSAANLVMRDDTSGIVKPLMAIGKLRVSRRELDTEKSTESEPVLLMKGEKRLTPGEIVPVELAIWPTAMKFNAGETLLLSVGPHYARVIDLPFGNVSMTVAQDGITFRPGDNTVEMVKLGAASEDIPEWIREQEPPAEENRNIGTHIVHFGGQYDSHLLVPLRRV